MIHITKGKGGKSLSDIALGHYERVEGIVFKDVGTQEVGSLSHTSVAGRPQGHAPTLKFDERNSLGEEFCGYLEVDGNMRRIISGDVPVLMGIAEELGPIYEAIDKPVKEKSDMVLKIFNYSGYEKWKPYLLASELGVDTCCYCNRLFTSTVGDDGDKGSRCQFDHFLPKSKYPYFALSFYNLIPCCSVCNSSLKGDVDFSFEGNVHPYVEGFGDDAVFSYIPKNYAGLIGERGSENSDIRLMVSDVNAKKKERIERNMGVFKLEDHYDEHKGYVADMVKKRLLYNADYLSSLRKQLPDLFLSDEELYRQAFGNYMGEEDYSRHVLAKLTRDIAEELGLIG
jgi:hypothetical protein